METQADMPAQSGFIYLLLDVAMRDGNGARGPVEEVLVGGDLTRLHWTHCTAQLLPRNRENVKQSSKYILPTVSYFIYCLGMHCSASPL